MIGMSKSKSATLTPILPMVYKMPEVQSEDQIKGLDKSFRKEYYIIV
jgi:hypothetical protein